MHRVERSLLVPYSADQMFALVADVKSYPRFLPWCAATRVRAQDNGSIEASIDVHYRGVRSRFTTRNEYTPPVAIRMHLIDGPFRRLGGEWSFTQLRDDGCKVHLALQFQFAHGLIGRMFAPVFESIATTMVDAFHERAQAIYGGR